MVISSRTPEGRANYCPVCGNDLRIEPSDPPGDSPCPHCGHLLWFAVEDLGDATVIRPTESRLDAESLQRLTDSVEKRSGLRLVIDLRDVQQLSSDALGRLINLKKHCGTLRVLLSVRHVHPDLMEIFRIARLDQVLDVAER